MYSALGLPRLEGTVAEVTAAAAGVEPPARLAATTSAVMLVPILIFLICGCDFILAATTSAVMLVPILIFILGRGRVGGRAGGSCLLTEGQTDREANGSTTPRTSGRLRLPLDPRDLLRQNVCEKCIHFEGQIPKNFPLGPSPWLVAVVFVKSAAARL